MKADFGIPTRFQHSIAIQTHIKLSDRANASLVATIASAGQHGDATK